MGKLKFVRGLGGVVVVRISKAEANQGFCFVYSLWADRRRSDGNIPVVVTRIAQNVDEGETALASWCPEVRVLTQGRAYHDRGRGQLWTFKGWCG